MKLITLVLSAFLFAQSVHAAPSVSGFVDAQLNAVNTGANSPTFQIFDGAVYFSHEMGESSVFLDLPFQGGAGGLGILGTRAQAYVKHEYKSGFGWTLGQFDSPLGWVPQDSADYALSWRGYVTSNFFVNSHTGLMLSFSKGPWVVRAFSSNTSNTGLRGGNPFEYALSLKYTSTTAFHFGVGALFQPIVGAPRYIVDVQAGTRFGALSVDANIGVKSNPGGPAAVGGLAQLGYGINDTWTVTARGEFAQNGATGHATHLGVTVGPQARMSSQLTVKLDVSVSRTVATAAAGGAGTTGTGAALAGVYKF